MDSSPGPSHISHVSSVTSLPPSSFLPSPAMHSATLAVTSELVREERNEEIEDFFEASGSEDRSLKARQFLNLFAG